MPNVVIIGGSNGSGKSTSASMLLQNVVHINNFVNADVIAQGLCAYEPERVAMQAGRVMLDRIHQLADQRATFAFETTLASRTFAPWVVRLKKEGYQFYLFFLWLQSEELAVTRVQERICMGGHSVPESTIRRRYHSGLRNFFSLYRPVADGWKFYDNSDPKQLNLIAFKTIGNTIHVKQAIVWQQLLEKYYAK